ncbi:MAG: SDR family oxidoreductase [Chitinophagaceae bacterium]
MNLSLIGKRAVVCGSTQGIGLAIAKELSLLGASCILLARNEAGLSAAIGQLNKNNGQQHTYEVADFANPEEVRLKIKIITEKGAVHILINNTGGPAAGPILLADEDALTNAFNQHLICNHILTKAVVPGMKEEGYGRIINIISTSVKIPLPNLGVSNTIRGAVASWAKTMANELGSFHITVNNILPGYTATGRLESIIKNTSNNKGVTASDVTDEMVKSIPAKRFGTAEEIAAVAAFLASPAASYVNGASIPVDGGRTGSI